jgi:TetR/AcrR family tetracycline transcriptional repressor
MWWQPASSTMATLPMIPLDRALADIEVPEPDPARWGEQLTDVAQQMRAVLLLHRDVIPASIGSLPHGGHALRFHDRVLAILRVSGLSDGQSVAALHLLWVLVNGFALEETRSAVATFDPELAPLVGEYFAALPGDRFPNLVAVAANFSQADADVRFNFLVDVVIDGLATRVVRS